MGSGLGKIQRAIVEALEERGDWTYDELVVRTFRKQGARMSSMGPLVREAHYRSFRRAIASLRERGYEIGVEERD